MTLRDDRAEAAVLSAMLGSDAVASLVLASPLRAEHFASDANFAIFAAIGEIMAQGMLPHPRAVIEQLRDRDQLDPSGGVAHLSRLAAGTQDLANLEANVRTVVEAALKRAVIATNRGTTGEVHDNVPLATLLSTAIAKLLVLQRDVANFEEWGALRRRVLESVRRQTDQNRATIGLAALAKDVGARRDWVSGALTELVTLGRVRTDLERAGKGKLKPRYRACVAPDYTPPARPELDQGRGHEPADHSPNRRGAGCSSSPHPADEVRR